MTRLSWLTLAGALLAWCPARAAPAPADLTRTVCPAGCDETDLLTAWRAALAQARESPGRVTLQLKPGRYEVTDQLFTDCACGKQVRVVGEGNDPANVLLSFTHIVGNNFGGFVAVDGGRVGLVDNLSIIGQGASTGDSAWAAQSYGAAVMATGSGSSIRVGAQVIVDGFYYGALADKGGLVIANGATFRRAGDANLLARFGGMIECQSCTVQTAGHRFTHPGGRAEVLGQNALAEGGYLYIDGAQLSGGLVACVGAQSNGLTWAHDVKAAGCPGAAAKASQNGVIELGGARLTGSAVGARADTGGRLNLDRVEIDRNASDGVQLDGGQAAGNLVRPHDNGGYGIHVQKQGRGEFYGTLANLRGNKAGAVMVDAGFGCHTSGEGCSPAGALIVE